MLINWHFFPSFLVHWYTLKTNFVLVKGIPGLTYMSYSCVPDITNCLSITKDWEGIYSLYIEIWLRLTFIQINFVAWWLRLRWLLPVGCVFACLGFLFCFGGFLGVWPAVAVLPLCVCLPSGFACNNILGS